MATNFLACLLHTGKKWTESVGEWKESSTFDVRSSMLHLPHCEAVLHGHFKFQV